MVRELIGTLKYLFTFYSDPDIAVDTANAVISNALVYSCIFSRSICYCQVYTYTWYKSILSKTSNIIAQWYSIT